MGKIVFIGAGAIGRGYLPWVFEPGAYDFVFVDNDRRLVDKLRQRGRYTSYRARKGRLEARTIPVKEACTLADFDMARHMDADVIFMSVGPRNVASAAAGIRGARCPVVLCENDPDTVAVAKGVTQHEQTYFAVPDVITSNTASPELLAVDELAIITEDGVLFVDDRASSVRGEICFVSEDELINKQWKAKLYIHNTPHCILAYLGSLVGATYVHEAMQNPEIYRIVNGSMNEMLHMLKLRWDIPHEFLDWYAEKELQRFGNVLLHDPISRVAREPLRKLDLEGRLIGAAQLCLSLGLLPRNILTGIASALLFESDKDEDKHLQFLRRNLSSTHLLTYILGLRKGEVLELVMRERLPKIIAELEKLVAASKGNA